MSRNVLLPISLLASLVGIALADDPAPPKVLARPEAHKTLVNPPCSHCIDEAKRRSGELKKGERVLAWIRGKYEGGAIPYRFFLVPYRVISDTYGVFVYDPDAGFARGFEPSLDFSFYGWRGGVMVMKHKDGTLYSCLSGLAFDGQRKGDRLKPIATLEATWGRFTAEYPGGVAYHMFEKYQPVEPPQGEGADSASTRGPVDPRLPAMEEVVGLSLGSVAKAYPIAALEKAGGLIADTVGGQPVQVLWLQNDKSAAVYSREVEGTTPPQTATLTVDPSVPAAPFVDRETGSRWGIEGRAVEGPLKGKTLRWLDSVKCRWFAWAAEHPQTQFQVAKAVGVRPPFEAVIVELAAITEESAAGWKQQGFRAVAAVLDDGLEPALMQKASRAAAAQGLELYAWIEVGRNPKLAAAHPEWMASLGMHDDWRRRFPNVPASGKDEVVKAFPWVPIGYREAFEAQLERVKKLLELAGAVYRGVLLNDLQGGPASCGCGNLQCRWALDYHVPATATVSEGDGAAARFVREVQKIAAGREVVPVWMTECQDDDLPESKRSGAAGTGLCGTVGCSVGTCPKAFGRQWASLLAAHSGPVGLLALHKELERDRPEYGSPGAWIGESVRYLEKVAPPGGPAPAHRGRLWVIVQGYGLTEEEEKSARRSASAAGAAAVLVARVRIDQSYEPRIVRAPSRH